MTTRRSRDRNLGGGEVAGTPMIAAHRAFYAVAFTRASEKSRLSSLGAPQTPTGPRSFQARTSAAEGGRPRYGSFSSASALSASTSLHKTAAASGSASTFLSVARITCAQTSGLWEVFINLLSQQKPARVGHFQTMKFGIYSKKACRANARIPLNFLTFQAATAIRQAQLRAQ